MSITICDTHLTRTVRYLSLTFEPVYYFLNCRDNGKTKMIENDEVIQTVEKRVETISNDCWTKWTEDFRIQQENELKLEFEEAHKRLEEAQKRLEEANKKSTRSK